MESCILFRMQERSEGSIQSILHDPFVHHVQAYFMAPGYDVGESVWTKWNEARSNVPFGSMRMASEALEAMIMKHHGKGGKPEDCVVS